MSSMFVSCEDEKPRDYIATYDIRDKRQQPGSGGRGKTTERLLPFWVELWLAVSAIICILDVFYTMMRPHTNRGGFLEHVYEGWNIYADVDYRYADTNDLVTMATGRVMIVEIVMNILALVLAHKRSRHAVLMAFTSTAFVFWKTVWYMVLYIRQPPNTAAYLNPEAGWLRVLLVFWVADGAWVVIPFAVLVALWNKLARLPEPRYEPVPTTLVHSTI